MLSLLPTLPPQPAVASHLQTMPVPNHVAIIMDGNGRWATSRHMPRSAGHLRGMRALRRTVEHARTLGIRYLTLFAFSTENWNRDEYEVDFLLRLLERYLKRELSSLIRHGVCVRIVGNRERLGPSLRGAIDRIERETRCGRALQLSLAISYGGQDDLVAAANSIAHACCAGWLSPDRINREIFERHLAAATLPPVDLLIRTGGEQRLSNFLLWHLAYAEIIFLPILWPDFKVPDLDASIREFARRQRRFGRAFVQAP